MRLALHQCRRMIIPFNRPFTTSNHFREQRQQSWEGYVPDTLDAPLHSLPVSNAPFESTPYIEDTAHEEALKRVQIVFGSKLAGPAQRPPPHLDPRSQLIAGVHVPPKPEEPDNCCMSGCAHCVWDQWREEMEVWSEKNGEAQRALAAREGGRTKSGKMNEEKSKGEDMLFADIPVGIREFMKTEKKLRERQGK